MTQVKRTKLEKGIALMVFSIQIIGGLIVIINIQNQNIWFNIGLLVLLFGWGLMLVFNIELYGLLTKKDHGYMILLCGLMLFIGIIFGSISLILSSINGWNSWGLFIGFLIMGLLSGIGLKRILNVTEYKLENSLE